MSVIVICSKDSDETRNMRRKNDNIEVMIGNETDEIIDKIFKSLPQKYQEGLEK